MSGYTALPLILYARLNLVYLKDILLFQKKIFDASEGFLPEVEDTSIVISKSLVAGNNLIEESAVEG